MADILRRILKCAVLGARPLRGSLERAVCGALAPRGARLNGRTRVARAGAHTPLDLAVYGARPSRGSLGTTNPRRARWSAHSASSREFGQDGPRRLRPEHAAKPHVRPGGGRPRRADGEAAHVLKMQNPPFRSPPKGGRTPTRTTTKRTSKRAGD